MLIVHSHTSKKGGKGKKYCIYHISCQLLHKWSRAKNSQFVRHSCVSRIAILNTNKKRSHFPTKVAIFVFCWRAQRTILNLAKNSNNEKEARGLNPGSIKRYDCCQLYCTLEINNKNWSKFIFLQWLTSIYGFVATASAALLTYSYFWQ